MKPTISLRLRPSNTEFWVFFPYSNETIRDTLLSAGIRYGTAAKGYILPAEKETLERVQATCQKQGLTLFIPLDTPVDLPSIVPKQMLLTQYCYYLTLDHYNPQTVKNYRTAFGLFLDHHAPRQPLELAKQDVLDYLTERDEAGISRSYQNLLINAIKFYYQRVENLPDYDILRPKRPQLSPRLLTRKEVMALVQGTENRKHRAMMMLAYGMGLRLNEVLALTTSDIDSQGRVLCIRGIKGKKTRYLPLPELLHRLLGEQKRLYSPVKFLFEGIHPGMPYSARSLQQVVQQAAARAGIQRSVTLHMLRHSYAAHLVESGTTIPLLQDLLGHTNIKSTTIYTQSNNQTHISSPLDDWI